VTWFGYWNSLNHYNLSKIDSGGKPNRSSTATNTSDVIFSRLNPARFSGYPKDDLFSPAARAGNHRVTFRKSLP
jgi:hypothetical protein